MLCARNVYSGALGSLGSFERAQGVLGCIRARFRGRRVHSRSLDSFRRAVGVVGFIWVLWMYSGGPWLSLGSFWRALVVKVFIGVRWVHSCVASGSFGLVGFTPARRGGRWVSSGAPLVWRVYSSSLDYSGAPWETSSSFS